MGGDLPASHFAGAIILSLVIQTEWGRVFELLADLTNEVGALAEMGDLVPGIWSGSVD